MLVEIMANSWSTYRNGVVYASQHNDFDSAILFLKGMVAVLPPNNQPVLPPIPIATDLKEDLTMPRKKWQWMVEAMPAVEGAISKWVHMNLDRAGVA